MTTGRVANKVALITGAASGLGAASARLLAREGARVVLSDLDEAGAQRVQGEIEAAGGTAIARRHDVTDEAAWAALMADILDRYRRLDVLVNCAGIGAGPTLLPSEQRLEDWHAIMRVNLDGVFLGIKHALAAMTKSDPVRGSIINISSVLGILGRSGSEAYSASKGGVRLLSKSAALSCAEGGLDVRVNSVHPGFIDTPLLRAGMKLRFNDQDEAQRVYDALAPVGRLGEPDDVAYGVLYLASDESKYVTGSELVIDGGFTAR